MRLVSIVLLCVATALGSCENDTERTESKTVLAQNGTQAKSKLGETGTMKLLSLLHHYYSLKEDMITPTGPGIKSPRELSAEATDLISHILADSTADTGIVPYLNTIQREAAAIDKLYDETGERKRLHFGVISSALYGLLKKAELKNVIIYHMYSNNAFNDKGAYWLSSYKEIRNPYFGKKLLEQGEIVDTLK
ncbi:MAG TPA: hypothetical protein VEB40_09665 [Flavipsychrobacter sp.]|nr:hypothetical protein [Flavipsychrobacter sp.]